MVGEGRGLGFLIAQGILDEHGASITGLDGIPNICFEIRFSKAEAAKNVAKSVLPR